MQYYNFQRLITKYSSEFKALVLSDGYYNDMGDWVKGEQVEKTMQGAILSIDESKIYRSEGTLTTNDRVLFTLEPIEDALIGSKVVYEDKTYSILKDTENAKFTGVYNYTLKYVSAFNGGVKND